MTAPGPEPAADSEADRGDPVRQFAQERNQRIGGAGDLRLRQDLAPLALSPRTQIAVLASDTARPIKTSMSLHFPLRGRRLPAGPANYVCRGNDTRIADKATSRNVAVTGRPPKACVLSGPCAGGRRSGAGDPADGRPGHRPGPPSHRPFGRRKRERTGVRLDGGRGPRRGTDGTG